MKWELVLALAVTIPVLLTPVFLVWYLNIGGAVAAARKVARHTVAGLKGKTVHG